MNNLTVKQFGLQYQNCHPEKIFSISWDDGDEIYLPPLFHFFDTVDHMVNYLKKMYITPFVLANDDTERWTKQNAILLFKDADMLIEITHWKYDITIYQFYNQIIYQELKQKLMI
jgi:hypothetical protein